jgi:hypothetical protein
MDHKHYESSVLEALSGSSFADTGVEPAGMQRSGAKRGWYVDIARLALVLVVLGFIWRTYRYALGLPIWGDEAFVAINFVWRDFAGMLEPLIYGQIVPLGYLWATEAVTRVMGYTEYSLHLVAFVAGLAGLALFYRFSRHVLPRSAHFLAVGIFAGSYFIARHSIEVKPYATDLLIALSLMMLGWAVWQKPRSLGRWIALIVLSAAAPWCSYPSMFAGGGVGLLLTWLLVRERYSMPMLVGYIAFGVVLCGNSLVMYQTIGKPQAELGADLFELASWSRTFPPLTEPWKLPVWFYDVHFGNMFAYPQGGAAPGSVLTFGLFCVGVWRLWRRDRALLLLLLGPFALNLFAAAIRAYPYGGSARVAQHLAPAICLLAGLGASVLFRRYFGGVGRRKALVISAIVLALVPIGDMIDSTIRPFKDPKTMAIHDTIRTTAGQTQPCDRWVVFNAIERVDHAPFLGDWRGVGGLFVFDVARFAPVSLDWSPVPETVEVPPGQRIWLLVYRADGPKVEFPRAQFRDYLEAFKVRFGEPEYTSVQVEDEFYRQEFVEVYRFDGPATE